MKHQTCIQSISTLILTYMHWKSEQGSSSFTFKQTETLGFHFFSILKSIDKTFVECFPPCFYTSVCNCLERRKMCLMLCLLLIFLLETLPFFMFYTFSIHSHTFEIWGAFTVQHRSRILWWTSIYKPFVCLWWLWIKDGLLKSNWNFWSGRQETETLLNRLI